MAMTHLSLSQDPTLAKAPTGFAVTLRDIRAYTGANETGRTIGLF
jgi:formyltetrahydrofolate synthetase